MTGDTAPPRLTDDELAAAKPPSLKCRCGRPVFLALDDLTPYCPGCEFGPCETCDCAP